MRRVVRPLALLPIALVLLVMGCAVKQGQIDTVTTTTNTVAIAGEQAKATNQLYVALCAQKAITAEECNKWSRFYAQFKIEYPAAARAYKAAVTVGNAQTAQEQARIIQGLSNQLALYFILKGK